MDSFILKLIRPIKYLLSKVNVKRIKFSIFRITLVITAYFKLKIYLVQLSTDSCSWIVRNYKKKSYEKSIVYCF